MQGDRAAPTGTSVKVLITQRSRVQIPPPPPLLSRAFVLHLLHGWVALRAVVSGFVSRGVRDHGSGPLLHAVENQVSDGRGCVSVHAGNDMAVGLEGEGDAGVAEALADYLGRDPGLEGGRRVAVAHVVQADPRQPGGPGVLLEPVGDVLGVERTTVGPGEDVAELAVAATDRLAVLGLALAVGV